MISLLNFGDVYFLNLFFVWWMRNIVSCFCLVIVIVCFYFIILNVVVKLLDVIEEGWIIVIEIRLCEIGLFVVGLIRCE